MAGNACSVMGITTKGNGGVTSEILPRFKNSSFTVFERQNARFRCTHCHTIFPVGTISRKSVKEKNECPMCFARGSLMTVAGRPVNDTLPNVELAERVQHSPTPKKDYMRLLLSRIRAALRLDSSLTTSQLAEQFEVSYQSMFQYLKKLGLKPAPAQRGRPPFLLG